ncbi:MAG: YggT family protein [Rothia sp. (in: high G+C Gram-positive bacteria)]|uniref:YggT family protein n=1 Tax=Rothia sp. (in: high G+C Gram-positive bacteria) TaxID=1885016 RepID=UPI0026DF601D|nr:YggT family protein [Rothia sp. (in: high G+C Gram-positive bacteria)]MDO5751105.1 YggT family protein [Rothia sp. (in: high G+C Gram-positive bacteria)]
MSYILAALTFAVYLLYTALILRMVFDWVRAFAKGWRPKGIMLVVMTAIYTVTDKPLNALNKLFPPLRIGNGYGLDIAFMILIVVLGFLLSILQNMTYSFTRSGF